jgi:signal transduction histidine kinase
MKATAEAMSSLTNVIEFPRQRFEQPPWHGAVLDERRRIARELHDVIAYSLGTISVQAGAAIQVLEDQPLQALGALEAIKARSKEALGELRVLLDTLRAEDLDPRGSTPGLGRLDDLVASTTAVGTPTQAHVIGRPRPLPAAVDLAAFRIVQESLTNVVRHAGRASALVTVRYERARLTVEVEDDGRGVADGQAGESEGSGHGIDGMRERARALGGELETGPLPEGGFRVCAWLPLFGRP